eukprot:6472316-Amphidinium_carterae.1
MSGEWQTRTSCSRHPSISGEKQLKYRFTKKKADQEFDDLVDACTATWLCKVAASMDACPGTDEASARMRASKATCKEVLKEIVHLNRRGASERISWECVGHQNCTASSPACERHKV